MDTTAFSPTTSLLRPGASRAKATRARAVAGPCVSAARSGLARPALTTRRQVGRVGWRVEASWERRPLPRSNLLRVGAGVGGGMGQVSNTFDNSFDHSFDDSFEDSFGVPDSSESVVKPYENETVGDMVAGLTLAFLSIPQGVAYAALAGLPPLSGVYANSVAPVVGATLGSSRYLQTGVMSMGAMLSGAAVAGLGLAPGSEVYIAASSLLAVMVGCARVVLSLFKGGMLVSKVPLPVMHGFTLACVWMVFSTQLASLTGVTGGPTAGHLVQKAAWIVTHPQNWALGPTALSALSAVVMLGGRRIHMLFPGPVVACALGCGAAAAGLAVGPVVGAVPSGLPTLQLGALQPLLGLVPSLAVAACAIALACFAEGAAISSRLAEEDCEDWDANRELFASGLAGIASGVLGGLTVSGAISRTSLAKAAGARTRKAAIITGLLVTAFVAAPAGAAAISLLPKATLAALVGVAVLPLLKPTPVLLGHPVGEQEQGTLDNILVGWATAAATLVVAPHLERGLIIGLTLAFLNSSIRKMLAGQQKPSPA